MSFCLIDDTEFYQNNLILDEIINFTILLKIKMIIINLSYVLKPNLIS